MLRTDLGLFHCEGAGLGAWAWGVEMGFEAEGSTAGGKLGNQPLTQPSLDAADMVPSLRARKAKAEGPHTQGKHTRDVV